MTTREYHFRLLVIDDDRVLLLYPRSSEELYGRRAKAALEFMRSDPRLAHAVPARSRELANGSSEPRTTNYKMANSMAMILAEVATSSVPVTAATVATNLQMKNKTASSRLSMLKGLSYLQMVERGKYLATPAGHQWLKDNE